MIGKFSVIVIVAVLAGAGYCALIASTYPFVLASPEARESLEVTDAQRAELNAAQHQSDLIAYGIFGAILCSVIAAIGFRPVAPKHRAVSMVVGLLVGAVAGVVMGLLGYGFFRVMDPIISDPMVHVFARLAVMFLPIAVAVGITVAFGAKNKSEMRNATMGALVGAMLTSLVYGVLIGLVTPQEFVAAIFPAHSQNRYLLFLTAFAAIGVITFAQINRKPAHNNSEATRNSGELDSAAT